MTDTRERDMLAAVRDGLRDIGYEGELLQEDYDFRDFLSDARDSHSSVRRVKLAAFAQSPPDYSYACFGVTIPNNETPSEIMPYRALGAPQILALHPSQGYVRRWKIGATGDPELRDAFTYERIAPTFREKRKQWEPQRILDARTLDPTVAAEQLDFFDAGLLPTLEASLRPRLERDIERIMQRCRVAYAQCHPNADFDGVLAPVFRLVFRLIAAKMLIDRRHKPEWGEMDAPGVISAIDGFYFQNVSPDPILSDRAVQDAAWEQVQRGLDLQNLSVATLAHLYENAFVTEELRRDQSIHATPPEVADYVVRQLPIEKLKYDERRIFEPFTGHAPFLTSALRRLRELLPKDISPPDRHDYFVAMLSGIENEPFAREIARYALILADYPNPDGWRIGSGNAFINSEFDRLLGEANIVLCNPPFGKFTPQERQVIGTETALTKEAEALRRVLLKHPAMIGFVLPRTFLSNRASRRLRLDLAERYKSVFVTVLPDKTFNEASQEVVLIVAHNVDLLDPPYSYAEVTSNGLEAFKRTGTPTWKTQYDTLVRKNNDVRLWRVPLQSVWGALVDYKTFDDVAEIHRGIEYEIGMVSDCVSNDPMPGFVPGLQTVRNHMEVFLISEHQYLCKDPDKMRDNAYLLPWDQQKVIANQARLSRGMWKLAGAIDEEGLCASQQFYGIWPKANTPVELLAALVSGPVANACLAEYPSNRHNQIRWIRQIPVPSLSEDQTNLIVSLVQSYASYRTQWLADPAVADAFCMKCRELLFQIDAAVLEAYALPVELERELLRQFDGAERRALPFDFPGYGEEYERAKEALQVEKAYRAVLRRYHELVDKTFLDGITDDESNEKERLRRRIDAHNAPFYERIFVEMDSREQ
jgi:hypothetical protein